MDIKKLIEDGTIQRAIEVLEHDAICAEALKRTIDCLHSGMMKRKRLDDREARVMEHCIEV
mgnify:CR=1 FL=1